MRRVMRCFPNPSRGAGSHSQAMHANPLGVCLTGAHARNVMLTGQWSLPSTSAWISAAVTDFFSAADTST